MNYIEYITKKFPNLAKKVGNSPKVWYKHYPHRVVLNRNAEIYNIWLWIGGTFGVKFREVPENKRPVKVRYGGRGSNTSIFLKEIKDVELAIEYFGPNIHQVEVPVTQQLSEIMKSNQKLVLKRKLFFDKYRYKVFINFDTKYNNELNLIVKWVVDTFFPDLGKNVILDGYNSPVYRNDVIWFRHTLHQPTVYLQNEDDLSLLKLTWNDHIDRIEVVKLISEVE